MSSSKCRRVVCTGIGTVNSLGLNAKKSWSALLQSKSGISKLKEEHSFDGGQSRVAAYVDECELKKCLEDPKQSYMIKNAKQLSRATTFAMLAADEALHDANILHDGHIDEKFRSNCGVAIGQGMVDFEDIYQNGKLLSSTSTIKNGFRKMSPFFMTRALMNMSAGNVSIRYKLNGPNHCVSTACATGAHSIGDAFQFIKNNKADMMICGSTEASINNIAMAGFERLRALCTKYNDKPMESSRPFDVDRAGFVMGEGSGIVILEELNHAKERGICDEKIYCELLGYGLSSDAHHLTAPLPDGGGAKKCMKAAMKDANIKVSDITHINAHATSTPLGDDIECNAIEEIFYNSSESFDKELTITSCKGSIGHLLGGAGSVETIFAMLSCKNAVQPHILNLKNPLTTNKNLVKYVTEKPKPWNYDKRILIKNSFGFGGTNASLIISNYIDKYK